MESFLLVALFCFLIYILNTIKGRFNNLEDEIQRLNKKLDLLKPIEKPVEKPSVLSVVIPKEEIKFEKPVEAKPSSIPPIKKKFPILRLSK